MSQKYLSTDMKLRLIQAALQGKSNAYSPYSKFPVGAAILGANGLIFTGGSIDNACYSETICAERVAIVKAVSEGTTSFQALAIVSNIQDSIPPCGLCRQVIKEFCEPDVLVLMPAEGWSTGDLTDVPTKTIGDLFPD
ncbi:cytidine deaminase [Dendrothele bispora CBS 962.96]|uniref:Cytidine deaminase n=1 Tax=Dendrothele bispora (strain CBS 962.96) TaxID=1314807 RepID=A0A4S8LXG6_DENBC|nr:cytidine deaminase [Dendrothele bispora CBS 962.96]